MDTPLLATGSSDDPPYVVSLKDQSGHQWLSDEPQESGGRGAGPNPQQLLLSALGACTVITLRMYAAHKRWPLSGIAVSVEFNSSSSPQGRRDVRRRISLRGELTSEQRERLLEIANHCPVHKVLTGEVGIESSLT